MRSKKRSYEPQQLARAIKERYPFLSDEESSRVAVILLGEVAKGIQSGKTPAMAYTADHDRISLDVLFISDKIEEVVREIRRARSNS